MKDRSIREIPYLPPQVDVARLDNDGMLLTREDRKTANEKFDEKNGEDCFLGKEETGLPYHLLQVKKEDKNERYVIYPYLIGQGRQGSVYLIQNIDTGKWEVWKKIYNYDSRAENEYGLLTKLEQEIGTLKVGKKKRQGYGIKYHRGKTISQLLLSQKLSERECIEIIIQLLKEVKILEDQRISHNDIYDKNVIVYQKKGKVKVKLIDFTDAKHNQATTNNAYQAEQLIKQILDSTGLSSFIENIEKSGKHPTVDEFLVHFTKKQQEKYLKLLPTNIEKCAYLNVYEYKNASKKQQELLLKALRNFNKVYLVGDVSDQDFYKIEKKFNRHRISLSRKVLASNDVQPLSKENKALRYFYQVTTKVESKQKNVIVVKENKGGEDYQKQIEKILLTNKNNDEPTVKKAKILYCLTEQINQLEKTKYKGPILKWIHEAHDYIKQENDETEIKKRIADLYTQIAEEEYKKKSASYRYIKEAQKMLTSLPEESAFEEFNYLPSQVNQKDLQENDKILSDLKIAYAIKKLKESRKEYLSRKETGLPYDILAYGDKYFAVYDKLGEGVYAQVSLIQDLQSGKWWANKNTRELKPSETKLKQGDKDMFDTEYSYLENQKKALAIVRNEIRKNKENWRFAFDYEKGMTLEKFKEQKNIPEAVYYEVFVEILKAIKNLHDKDKSHRDLTFRNIMIYRRKGKIKVKLIDFGTIANLDQNGDVFSAEFYGAVGYMPPEVRNANNNGESQYGKLSETFTAGMMIADFLNLTVDSEVVERVQRNGKWYELGSIYLGDDVTHGKIKNKERATKVHQLLAEMTTEKREDRKKIPDAIDEFSALQKAARISLPTSIEKCAYLNINEFNSASNAERTVLLNALSNFDTVYLVGKISSQEFHELQEIFAKKDVHLSRKILKSDNIAPQSKQNFRYFYKVTAKETDNAENVIIVNKNKSSLDYQKEIEKNLLVGKAQESLANSKAKILYCLSQQLNELQQLAKQYKNDAITKLIFDTYDAVVQEDDKDNIQKLIDELYNRIAELEFKNKLSPQFAYIKKAKKLSSVKSDKPKLKEFNYLPHQVKPEALHANGKILTDLQVEYAKSRLNDAEIKYLDKQKTGLPYDILAYGDKSFALFDILGEGAYGTVYLIQDLDTGKWWANKSSDVSASLKRRGQGNQIAAGLEFAYLKELGKAFAIVKSEEVAPEKAITRFGFDFEKGVTLYDLIHGKNSISEEVCYEIISQFLQAVAALHAEKKVHRDLKPENIMVYQENNKIKLKLVDFASIKDTDDKGNANERKLVGSEHHAAPETYPTGPNGDCTYNFYTDIFSAGLVVADLLNIAELKDAETKIVDGKSIEIRMLKVSDDLSKCRIKNEVNRKKIHGYLKNMTSENNTFSRGSAQDALDFFDKLKKEQRLSTPTKLSLPTKIEKCAYLNLREFEAASIDEKKLLLHALSHFDTVYLVGKTTNKDFYELQRLFNGRHIHLSRKVLSTSAVAPESKRKNIRKFYTVTLNANDTNENVIHVAKNKSDLNYKKEIERKLFISKEETDFNELKEKIVYALREQIFSLKKSGYKNANITKLIADAYEDAKSIASKDALTDLINQLYVTIANEEFKNKEAPRFSYLKKAKKMLAPKIPGKEFTFLPSQVNIKHLHTNGKILTALQIAYAKERLSEIMQGEKYLKCGDTKLPYDVLAYGNDYFAVYKMFDRGANAEISLLQNLDTGEWSVNKRYVWNKKLQEKPGGNPLKKEVDNTYDFLKSRSKVSAEIVHTDPYSHFGFEYEKGKSLDQLRYHLGQKKVPDHVYLEIISQILQKLAALHAENKVHRDLHYGNIMVYQKNNKTKVKFIDFDTLADANQSNSKFGLTAIPCEAPESRQKGGDGCYPYNFATDIYTVGISIADILNLTKVSGQTVRGRRENVLELESDITNGAIQDPATAKAVYDFLAKMTNVNPASRGTASDNYQEFLKITENFNKKFSPELTPQIEKCAYLNLNEFKTASSNDRYLLLKSLKYFDKVYLVGDKLNAKDFYEAQKFFEGKGVTLSRKLLPNVTVKPQSKDKGKQRFFYAVTARPGFATNDNGHSLNVKNFKTLQDFKNAVDETIIVDDNDQTKNQKIIYFLRQEIQRLKHMEKKQPLIDILQKAIDDITKNPDYSLNDLLYDLKNKDNDLFLKSKGLFFLFRNEKIPRFIYVEKALQVANRFLPQEKVS